MQEKQITNAYKNPSQKLSPRELRAVAEARELLQTIHNPSPEEIEQLILTVPANYREMAIQIAAEQFVTAIKVHILQLTMTYCQQVEKEGISSEDRDETLRDVEADVHEIMTLNQRLDIDSVEKLFKLGTMVVNVMKLGHSKNAEETERSLYTIPGMYQGWLERIRLMREEQSE